MWDEVFYHCSSLSSAYFLGDVPDYDNGGFFDLTSPQFIIYYLPGKNGWDHFYEDYKTKEYTGPYGSLQVQLLPNQMTINMGAQWRVDSGEWQGSGTTVSGLFPSRHTIKFSEVNGWTKPTNQIVSIQDNTTTKVTATYQVDGALHGPIDSNNLQIGIPTSPLVPPTKISLLQTEEFSFITTQQTKLYNHQTIGLLILYKITSNIMKHSQEDDLEPTL